MKRKNPYTMLNMHIVIVVLLLLLISLVGYIYLLQKQLPESTIPNQSSSIINASFQCDNKKTIQVVFYNGKAEVTLSDGRTLLLLQALSGSGVRYTNTDESITFWNKGNTAFIEEGKNSMVSYNNCLQIPEK